MLLIVSTTTDFRNRTLRDITDIGLSGTGVRATFDASQFDNVAISTSVAIYGTSANQQIVVAMASPGSFSAAGWDVGGWRADGKLHFRGSSGNDAITGTSKADTIEGGNGRDTLSGGAGNDTFLVDANDIAVNESINGGSHSGTIGDTLSLQGGGSFNLSVASIVGVERLLFNGTSAVTMTGGQAAGFRSFDNQSGTTQSVTVNGSSVDLSHLAFIDWTSASTIVINGTGVAGNTLTGTSLRDTIVGHVAAVNTITGGAGSDRLTGGSLSDVFVFAAGDWDREVIDGGGGNDTIHLTGSGAYAFYQGGSMTSIETVRLEAGAEAHFDVTQIGAGKISTVIGSAGFNRLHVQARNAGTIDLSALTFINWNDAEDGIDVADSFGDDVVIGTDFDDSIGNMFGVDEFYGRGGNDSFGITAMVAAGEIIDGGEGFDTLFLMGVPFSDFSACTVTGIELVRYGGDVEHNITFAGSQLGAGAIATIVASAGVDRLIVTGAVDLSGVIQGWNNAQDAITLRGTAAAETIIGSGFNDTILAGGGDDLVVGGAGADTLNGEGGVNTLSYAGSAVGVTVNLGNAQVSGGDAAGDVISNFQNLIGSAQVDALLGDGLANIIDGGAGADQLFGGLNNDTFVFRRGEAVGDTVFDFAGNGAAAGDQLRFEGYGAGATLVQIDATHWEVRSTFGVDSFVLANGAAIAAGDVLFV